jgi:hypothetical protein
VQLKHSDLQDEVLENHIVALGKSKKICITEKKNRQNIIDLLMLHLQFHPFSHMDVLSKEDLITYNSHDTWIDQVTEMHQLCQELGESWAWEYLWKHWYRSDRWPIWARSIAKEIPIIHSNGIVESLWSVLKKQYLRQYSRPKLEFLIHIIMDEYLPNRIMLIEQHRKLGRFQRPVKPIR